MKLFQRLAVLTVALFATLQANAQDVNGRPEMADVLRANGKINVVISVLVTIFIGIVIFLITQEIRLRKIEKKINNKNS